MGGGFNSKPEVFPIKFPPAESCPLFFRNIRLYFAHLLGTLLNIKQKDARMLKTGVQIKTASFPPLWRWREDLLELKQTGISRIMVTIPWLLVEKCPARFDFSLFEEYFSEAVRSGFELILTPDITSPPLWIREEPEHCIDNAKYRRLLLNFFREVAAAYGEETFVHAWNLTDLTVDPCSCADTRELFCRYLQSRFGRVELLNEKWHRNYFSFEYVPTETPECFPDSAETMAFLDFLRLREENFIREVVAELSARSGRNVGIFLPPRIVESLETAGGAVGIVLEQRSPELEQVLALASAADTFKGRGLKIIEKTTRSSYMVREAPLSPSALYRFLWNSVAYGAEEVVLGEWDKDAVCNALTSDDFLFGERKRMLHLFGEKMASADSVLNGWKPESGSVAIFRSRVSERFLQMSGIYLKQALASFRGWIRALAESSTPFSVCNEATLDILKDKKLLILPGTPVITNAAGNRILEFVRRGGILLCEPECGAWSSNGVALRPDSRFIAEATGVCEMARFPAENMQLRFKYGKKTFSLSSGGCVVPIKTLRKYTEVIVPYKNDTAILESIVYGKGKILLPGAFLGMAAAAERNLELENFLNALLDKVSPEYNLITPSCRVISGRSSRSRVLFIFGGDKSGRIEINFNKSFWKKHALRDLISGKRITISGTGNIRSIRFVPDPSGVAVLCEESKLG